MFTPTQLEVIRVFGRKELTEGCKVICNDESIKTVLENSEFGFYIQPNGISDGYICYENEDIEMGISEILGHIPHLEDVFIVAEEKGKVLMVIQRYSTLTVLNKIEDDENPNSIVIAYNPTLPLIEQPESTLLELLKLFK